MKEFFAGLAVFLGGLILLLALGFGLNLFGLANYSFFAPKYRAVDNQVFKQSEQYNDGMVRDLENLQLEYINADQAHKDALRAIVLHRFSVYPEDKLPPNLRNFYNDLRSGKN
jgi:hypothetical protein